MRAFVEKNWFTLALFLLPLAAWPWPELGGYDGILHASTINKVAVAIIFFMNGITLNYDIMIRAAKKVKLAITIQLFCFALAPAIALLGNNTLFLWVGFSGEFITGTYILACLPTTIASCAIFTHMAGGDRSASLFNAVLSNFIGILFAPIALSYLLGFEGGTLHFSSAPIIYELCYLIVIPLVAGQLIGHHYHTNEWKVKPYFTLISKVLLLIIVYSAFCNSIIEARSENSPLQQVLTLLLCMGALHGTYLFAAYCTGRCLAFSDEDRIAILFTAPQKTIAVGIPLSIALITSSGGEHGLGFTMLPLLLYNNIQWLAAASLQTLFFSSK